MLVHSDQTAEHIAALLGKGWTRQDIARAAGVSAPLITKAQHPGKFLNEGSAAAILGVGDVVPGSFDVSGQKREPLIVRLTWRGHLVLIAGVAVLFAGTAAGHNQRTDIRQGGVVVAWVSGGGPMPRSWLYCDNETLAYDGQDGRLYVDGRLNGDLTHDTLGWAVRVGTNGWKVWANRKLTGRTVLVGSVIRQSSSRWNIVRTARQPLYAQWVRIKPRLVAQAVGRDGVAAGASFLLHFGTCR